MKTATAERIKNISIAIFCIALLILFGRLTDKYDPQCQEWKKAQGLPYNAEVLGE